MSTANSSSIRRLRAAWVLPVSSKPIRDGEVVLEGNRIVDVRASGSDTYADTELDDFGDAIIMPGLVNVHTHLDYTVMRGLLEDVEFFPWIRELTARKSHLDMDDWIASATCGAAEAVAGGITCIGDCCDSGAALHGALALGLRGVVYQEVFGIDELRSVASILEELRSKVDKLRQVAAGSLIEIGISPHAPYTVRAALMRALAEYAIGGDLKVCIHASESQAEAELLRGGTGPIAAMFTRRGIVWEAPKSGTVTYLRQLGILNRNTLLVHGVQLSAAERSVISEHEVAWAHCPKSNAKLGNGVADLGLMGVHATRNASNGPARIGLGSDSVASNNTMDLFEEMRFSVLMQRGVRRKISALSAQEAVEMATWGGARALGYEKTIGTLEPGKSADICVVRVDGVHAEPAYDPYNALVYTARASDVVQTIIAGELRYDAARPRDERFIGFDLSTARRRLALAIAKMRDWKSEATG